jgi:UDPglucose 6-dehydrogenase
MKLGLIGRGFVGNAIYENLKEHYPIIVYDKNEELSTCGNVRDVCHNADIVYVALPTPMKTSGQCDLSIIFNVMAQISHWYADNIVVIKSTIPPGTCEAITKINPNIKIVFSPEFLTERNSIEDFKTSNRVIFGGAREHTQECVNMMSKAFPDKQYEQTDWKTAEMVKYFINTFLACKVSFANEMKQICDSIDTEYEQVKDLALLDNRIGKSHFKVPGPDGIMGFGGTCFPKDLNCLIYFAKENGITPSVLECAWNKNLEIRDNKDWLAMLGRAVSKT